MDESRSDELHFPGRGSPLPWLLLAVCVLAAIGIFAMARSRLNDEKLRTANALKANDEVMGRLRSVASEYAKSQLTVTELESKKALLERQVAELEERGKAQSAELEGLKDRKKRK